MYQYKNTFNLSDEEFENFKKNPHEWFLKELNEARLHDPLLAECYEVFQELYLIDTPFKTLEFLAMALYQALLSNSVNQQQLIKVIQQKVE